MTPERYQAWLQLLVDGNQNMIRVWGGGIYEHDSFYDTCDGTLCWNTFHFSSDTVVELGSKLKHDKIEHAPITNFTGHQSLSGKTSCLVVARYDS